MQTKILGMSGKKQSGKDTGTNYIIGLFMERLEIISGFVIQDDGRLWINDIFGDTRRAGIYDIRSSLNQKFNQEYVYGFIKVYSYADELKNLCINILGLNYEQCYGTDEEKNSQTHLQWEDMPGQPPAGKLQDGDIAKFGKMRGREVMQFVGTEIFRKMYADVWVDATIRKIESDNPTIAIISDVRFINEVTGIQKRQGKVIRMMRCISGDKHNSERALDDFPGFDHIIDKDVDIIQQNLLIEDYLNSIHWIPRPISEAYPE